MVENNANTGFALEHIPCYNSGSLIRERALKKEIYISVDIEADGPIPGKEDYSMLSLGACEVYKPENNFYVELKPISVNYRESCLEAIRPTGLDRNKCIASGSDPIEAMVSFENWIFKTSGNNGAPVFSAFNATFDWMFTHWYFEHFLGRDPFGISGWDIKAYYLGVVKKLRWSDSRKSKIQKRFLSNKPHTHNALDDAIEQADIFRKLRDEVKRLNSHKKAG